MKIQGWLPTTTVVKHDNKFQHKRINKNQYSIYRVCNLDEENNFAEFYELCGDVESQLLMKPTHFEVLVKKEV